MDRNKTLIKKKINKYIGLLKNYVEIDKVILYGSWAHGNPHEFSDIDLAVFSPDFGKHKLKELQLLSKLSWEIDETIEAIPYSSSELDAPEPTSFVYEIINNGETIYDKPLTHSRS